MTRLRRVAAGCVLLLVPALSGVASAETAWEAYAKYQWPAVLSEHDVPDYALVAAYVTTLPDVAVWKPEQFYARALAARPNDPLTLYTTATWCFYAPDHNLCFDQDILRLLVERDPDNGIPLMMLAVRALVRHEDDAALQLLRDAASRARLDGYWGQMAGVLRRTIRDTVPADLGDPGALAFSLALVRPRVEAGIHDVCTSPGAKLLKRDWNAVCLALGRALEERGATLLMVQTGLSMQRRLLKLDEDTRALAALEQRAGALEELEQLMIPAGAAQQRYWSDLELYGEMEARRRARAQLAGGPSS